MKKIVLGLVIIAFIALIVFLVKGAVIRAEDENVSIVNKVIDEEKVLDGSNINDIEINCYNVNVNLIPEDDNKIRAHISGNIPVKGSGQAYSLLVSSSEGKASIEVKWDKTITVALMKSQQLDIYIPKEYDKSIGIDASNGTVNAGDFNLQNFNAKVTSGDIDTDLLKAENTNVKSTSGYIKLNGFDGNLTAKSSSGSIDVQCQSFDNALNLQSTSGDLGLSLPKDAEFYLKAKSSSGKVNCGFSIKVKESGKNKLEGTAGDGRNEIVMETHSGDINIQ